MRGTLEELPATLKEMPPVGRHFLPEWTVSCRSVHQLRLRL